MRVVPVSLSSNQRGSVKEIDPTAAHPTAHPKLQNVVPHLGNVARTQKHMTTTEASPEMVMAQDQELTLTLNQNTRISTRCQTGRMPSSDCTCDVAPSGAAAPLSDNASDCSSAACHDRHTCGGNSRTGATHVACLDDALCHDCCCFNTLSSISMNSCATTRHCILFRCR